MRSTHDPHRRRLALGLLGLLGQQVQPSGAAPAAPAAAQAAVPVLVYHRFAATALDSMTLSLARFEAQLDLIERLGGRVIAMDELLAWRRGEQARLPQRALVLSADDGHRSQYEQMAPRLRERGWPVTLFVYPSAISNAGYAMRWEQLQALAAGPGCSVQSHSYWHPDFLRERRRLAPAEFRRFVDDQLRRSKRVLEQRLQREVSQLAWPFGLSDADLWAQAADCGYRAGFALGNRSVRPADPELALPRHLMVDSVGERALAARLEAAFAAAEPAR